jgi:hypothetical protein
MSTSIQNSIDFIQMKNHSRFALPFLFILVANLLTALLLDTKSHAVEQVCNRDPGKEANTSTSQSSSAKVREYIVKVQLRYNNKTKEKWSRACIPVGTVLYLKDKSGRTYGTYTAQVYGWNYGDKVRTSSPMKACAKHPSDSREFCTSFG